MASAPPLEQLLSQAAQHSGLWPCRLWVPPLDELSITFYTLPETDFPCNSNVDFVPPFLAWPGILFFSFGLSGVLAKIRIHPAVLLFDIKACKGKECWGWGFLAKAILPEYPLC